MFGCNMTVSPTLKSITGTRKKYVQNKQLTDVCMFYILATFFQNQNRDSHRVFYSYVLCIDFSGPLFHRQKGSGANTNPYDE